MKIRFKERFQFHSSTTALRSNPSRFAQALLTSKTKKPRQIAALLVLAAGFASSSAVGESRPTVGMKVVTPDENTNARAYWTPERRAKAKPMKLAIADRSQGTGVANTPISRGPQVFVEGKGPEVDLVPDYSGPAVSASDRAARTETQVQSEFSYVYPFSTYYNADYSKFPGITMGRLAFTLDGVDYFCTASVIRPHTLVTARQCIYDVSTNTWATNIIFYPGYNNGRIDTAIGGGVWSTVFAEAFVNQGWNYDLGLIALHDENGTGCAGDSGTSPIEHYTGYLGYTYNGDYSQRQWAVFGYPGVTNPQNGNPFNGKWPIRSDAATGHVNDDIGGDFLNTVEIGSDQTPGANGGPWIIGYNPSGKQTVTFGSNNTVGTHGAGNYANSVTSFTFADHPLAINGPEFDDYNFFSLLTFYNNLSCN